jgi:hypothetical protein
LVFHRILDFKTRLGFYPASIFAPTPELASEPALLIYPALSDLSFLQKKKYAMPEYDR